MPSAIENAAEISPVVAAEVTRLNFRVPKAVLTLSLLTGLALAGFSQSPGRSEIEELVGEHVRVRIVKGQVPSFRVGDSCPIYEVETSKFDAQTFRKWATLFELKGEPAPIPSDYEEAPGWWVQERKTDSSRKRRCLYFSLNSGTLGYASGDDGHRWDVKAHKPLMENVPSSEQASKKVVELLPRLGLSIDQFSTNSAGKPDYRQLINTIRYSPRGQTNQLEVVKKRSIILTQKLPEGNIIGAGTLTVSFISHGMIAGVECSLVKLSTNQVLKHLTVNTITERVHSGAVWTRQTFVPSEVLIKTIRLVYPTVPTGVRERFLWPFYEVTCCAPHGSKEYILYVKAW